MPSTSDVSSLSSLAIQQPSPRSPPPKSLSASKGPPHRRTLPTAVANSIPKFHHLRSAEGQNALSAANVGACVRLAALPDGAFLCFLCQKRCWDSGSENLAGHSISSLPCQRPWPWRKPQQSFAAHWKLGFCIVFSQRLSWACWPISKRQQLARENKEKEGGGRWEKYSYPRSTVRHRYFWDSRIAARPSLAPTFVRRIADHLFARLAFALIILGLQSHPCGLPRLGFSRSPGLCVC